MVSPTNDDELHGMWAGMVTAVVTVGENNSNTISEELELLTDAFFKLKGVITGAEKCGTTFSSESVMTLVLSLLAVRRADVEDVSVEDIIERDMERLDPDYDDDAN